MSNEASSPKRASAQSWAYCIALLTMFLTLIPYLIGWSFAGNRQFMWLGYNVDDSCVYLSWMRQAADGSLRALNLFTTEPQHGMLLNPLFLILGWIARLTHLPLIAVYHLSRLAFGFGLLLIVWEFIRSNIDTVRAQKLAFLCVCCSSGLGWLPPIWNLRTSIDSWQPEAITFLSLYLSPLFCFSMALQVAIILLLQKGERMGQARFALAAGLCGFVLGLVHTYDIITMAAIWAGYLAIRILLPIIRRDFPPPPKHLWIHSIIAGLFTAPAVAYIAWQLQSEHVFRARAEVKTLSASLSWVLFGYGITLVLALFGLYAARSSLKIATPSPTDKIKEKEQENNQTWLIVSSTSLTLLTIWMVVNLAISYLPGVAFQRKLLQGEHFPIAILAGVGLTWLLSRMAFLRKTWHVRFTTAMCIFLLSISNIQFTLRDIGDFQDDKAQPLSIYRAYLNQGELDAFEWIRTNTPVDAAVQPLPWIVAAQGRIGVYDATLACFAPGFTHRAVYGGHWGETPDWNGKLKEFTRLLRPDTSDEERSGLLRKMKVKYLLFSQKYPNDPDTDRLLPFFRGLASVPPYLRKIYSNPDADIYEVVLP